MTAKALTSIVFRTYYNKAMVNELSFSNMKYRIDIAAYYNNKSYGYELKVSKQDLKNDVKIYDYCNYFNYLYLVVPDYLEEDAKLKVKDTTIGLLIAKGKKVVMVIKPKLNKTPLISYDEWVKKIEKAIFYRYKNFMCKLK